MLSPSNPPPPADNHIPNLFKTFLTYFPSLRFKFKRLHATPLPKKVLNISRLFISTNVSTVVRWKKFWFMFQDILIAKKLQNLLVCVGVE